MVRFRFMIVFCILILLPHGHSYAGEPFLITHQVQLGEAPIDSEIRVMVISIENLMASPVENITISVDSPIVRSINSGRLQAGSLDAHSKKVVSTYFIDSAALEPETPVVWRVEYNNANDEKISILVGDSS